jgi:hypothetical protein
MTNPEVFPAVLIPTPSNSSHVHTWQHPIPHILLAACRANDCAATHVLQQLPHHPPIARMCCLLSRQPMAKQNSSAGCPAISPIAPIFISNAKMFSAVLGPAPPYS